MGAAPHCLVLTEIKPLYCSIVTSQTKIYSGDKKFSNVSPLYPIMVMIGKQTIFTMQRCLIHTGKAPYITDKFHFVTMATNHLMYLLQLIPQMAITSVTVSAVIST